MSEIKYVRLNPDEPHYVDVVEAVTQAPEYSFGDTIDGPPHIWAGVRGAWVVVQTGAVNSPNMSNIVRLYVSDEEARLGLAAIRKQYVSSFVADMREHMRESVAEAAALAAFAWHGKPLVSYEVSFDDDPSIIDERPKNLVADGPRLGLQC